MKSNLKFGSGVNKEKNAIVVRREFAADLASVWKAWTTADVLDKWWGPEPCRAKTKSMDFHEGGEWLYCMVVPAAVSVTEEEQTHWGKQRFKKIVTHQCFSGIDVFCDENGNIDPALPEGKFENSFSKQANGNTLVTMVSKHQNYEELQMVIDMGYIDGITQCFMQLDGLLRIGSTDSEK